MTINEDLEHLKKRYKKLYDLFPNNPIFAMYYKRISNTINEKLINSKNDKLNYGERNNHYGESTTKR